MGQYQDSVEFGFIKFWCELHYADKSLNVEERHKLFHSTFDKNNVQHQNIKLAYEAGHDMGFGCCRYWDND